MASTFAFRVRYRWIDVHDVVHLSVLCFHTLTVARRHAGTCEVRSADGTWSPV